MAGNAIKAGEAFLTLAVRDKGFASSLQRSLGRMRSFGRSISFVGASISGVGALLTAPFAKAINIFQSVGDNLDKMAARTGVSVEELSQLQFALSQSGTSAEQMEKALGFLGRVLLDIETGSQETVKKLQALGLSIDGLKGKSPAEAFEIMLDRIGQLPAGFDRMTAAMVVFGKSGKQLLPLAGNFAELRRQAEHFGLTVSTGAAKRAAVLNDAFDLLSRGIMRVAIGIGDALAGPLSRALRGMSEVVAVVIRWIDANKPLVLSVAGVAGAITLLGGSITGFGLSLAVFGFALSGIVGLMSALVSPVALVVAGVTAATAAFVKFTATGQAVAQFLSKRFVALLSIARDTFAGIANALAAGDIQAAADVLWAGLKVAWLEGTKELQDTWINFKDLFLRTTINLIFDVQKYWADFAAAVKTIWNGMVTQARITGEDIGHYLSRSDDPATAADQDAAHETAKSVIRAEGDAKRAEIEANRKKELAAIKSAAATADAERNRAHSEELANRKKELADAQEKFKAATAAAAASKLPGALADGFQAALANIGGTASGIKSRTLSGGRFAEQVFGGPTKGDPIPRQQLIEARKATRLLERIERKKGFELRVGNS